MLSYIRNGCFWATVVATVLSFAIGTSYTFAGKQGVVPVKDKQSYKAPQPLSQTEVEQLTQRDFLNSSLRNIVAEQGAPRPCNGCGGSGRAVDFNRRQGIPLGTPFDRGNCPRCRGTGHADWGRLDIDGSEGEVTARDGTFVAYATGIVKDTSTGLEWFAGSDRNTTWYEARFWVSNLTVGGGGWRMPTTKELNTLYQKGAGINNMTLLLKTTGWWVWSGETKGSSKAWYFAFNVGYPGWGTRTLTNIGRGFAVRSRR